jgi:hypothetical protein
MFSTSSHQNLQGFVRDNGEWGRPVSRVGSSFPRRIPPDPEVSQAMRNGHGVHVGDDSREAGVGCQWLQKGARGERERDCFMSRAGSGFPRCLPPDPEVP